MKNNDDFNTTTAKVDSAIDQKLLAGLGVHKSDHIFGNADAKIIIVVYEDYECENCGKSYREIKSLREYFKREICIVFRHFPVIQMHPSAFSAALVVEASAIQDKFLQAHDLIFEYQELLEYGTGGIVRLLQKRYSVSIDQLNKDLKREDLKRKIKNDVESGKRCGVKNTPAIFINGDEYKEAVKFDQMADVIKKMISKNNIYLKNKLYGPFERNYLLRSHKLN